MPKPIRKPNGVYTLSVGFNKRKRKLTLGLISEIQANSFAANIEQLQSHVRLKPGTAPIELHSWIGTLSSQHRKQLGELGLLAAFNPAMTVGELIDCFTAAYDEGESSASTKYQMRQALDRRVTPVIKSIRVSDLEPDLPVGRPNAKPVFTKFAKSSLTKFHSWQKEFYVKSTWSKDNGRIRQMGRWAVEHGIVDHNPFTLLPKPGEKNDERLVYVPRAVIFDAMDQTLDPDTRITMAMGRLAGIRTPSEIRTLKWEYVDFHAKQLHIMDSKKKKIRLMPLFDDIAEELERHRTATTESRSRFILTERARQNTDANNYNLIKEAIIRSGHDLWPRLRQNLRTSCENDFLDFGFREHEVTEWLGHTVKVSRQHYQKQTNAGILANIERMRNR